MTTKPDLTRVWAETAPVGNVVDPDVTTPGKVTEGWVAEVPPFEHFNYLQQWFSQGLAHANEYGIMQWDTDSIYPAGGWARSTVDNKVYESIVGSNQGNEPSVSPGQWVARIAENASQGEVDTGTDDTKFITPLTFENSSQLAARTTVASQGEVDTGTNNTKAVTPLTLENSSQIDELRTAIANLQTVDAVGSYSLLFRTPGATQEPGDLVDCDTGNGILRYSNARGGVTLLSFPTGIWKVMGSTDVATGQADAMTTLYVKISEP
jgi:hypothetical protein